MRGWKQVFSFTFMQNIKGKSFKLALFGIAALVFMIMIAIHIIIGAVNDDEFDSEAKEEVVAYDVDTIYLVNHSGLSDIAFSGLTAEGAALEGVTLIEETAQPKEIMERIGSEEKKMVVAIEKYSYSYETEAYLPWDEMEENKGELTYRFIVYTKMTEEEQQEDSLAVAEVLADYFREERKVALGLSEETCVVLNLWTDAEVLELNELDDSLGEVLVKMFVPMLFTLIIYMLVLLYGQSISNSIVVEKSSKLMEMLLTSLEPYAIVFGKILAMFSVAMLQFATWVLSGIAGYFTGSKLAERLFEHYEEPLGMLLDMLKQDVGSAFSAPAVILGVFLLILGFFMYCVLAGLVAASIKKAEDVSNGSGVYQIVVVIAFLAAYMLPIAEVSDVILTIVRLIPITAAFMLPADVIIGNCSLMIAGLGLAIMLLTTIVLVYFTGKIYKKKMF